MSKPRPRYAKTGNRSAPRAPCRDSPEGWRPCMECGRWAGEMTEPDERGISWAITAAYDHPPIKPGEAWTCKLCAQHSGSGRPPL